jgi:hypothetical protein
MSDTQVIVVGVVALYAIRRGFSVWFHTPWGSGGAKPSVKRRK